MFETLITTVKTGRIQKKLFETLAEAEQHIARKRDQLLNRKRNGEPCPASLRDYRMEVVYREMPKVLAAPARQTKKQAA